MHAPDRSGGTSQHQLGGDADLARAPSAFVRCPSFLDGVCYSLPSASSCLFLIGLAVDLRG